MRQGCRALRENAKQKESSKPSHLFLTNGFAKSTNLKESTEPPHPVSTNAPARDGQRNNVQYLADSAAAAQEGPRVVQTYAPVVAAQHVDRTTRGFLFGSPEPLFLSGKKKRFWPLLGSNPCHRRWLNEPLRCKAGSVPSRTGCGFRGRTLSVPTRGVRAWEKVRITLTCS